MSRMSKHEIQEHINPELFDYIEETSDGLLLKHPLVSSAIVAHVFSASDLGAKNGAELANAQFLSKQTQLEEALRLKNWSFYVFLHERYARLSALRELLEIGDIKNPWPLVADVWSDGENIHQNKRAWREVWTTPHGCRHTVMTETERMTLASLPDQIELWRGVSNSRAIKGFSWTLDRSKAEWFAHRFANFRRPRLLVRGTILKRNVLAYLNGRSEHEIVTLPEHVRVAEVTNLTPNL